MAQYWSGLIERGAAPTEGDNGGDKGEDSLTSAANAAAAEAQKVGKVAALLASPPKALSPQQRQQDSDILTQLLERSKQPVVRCLIGH